VYLLIKVVVDKPLVLQEDADKPLFYSSSINSRLAVDFFTDLSTCLSHFCSDSMLYLKIFFFLILCGLVPFLCLLQKFIVIPPTTLRLLFAS
jgi:hypothetical protein